METEIGVHDNWVYAQVVDHDHCRIVLHTVYPHSEPTEYTDIVFEDVFVHHFQEQHVGKGPNPSNVLFDAEEVPAVDILEQYQSLFENLKGYCWPTRYTDQEDLLEKLKVDGTKCFHIHGTFGLTGFVFAGSMTFQPRSARANPFGSSDNQP